MCPQNIVRTIPTLRRTQRTRSLRRRRTKSSPCHFFMLRSGCVADLTLRISHHSHIARYQVCASSRLSSLCLTTAAYHTTCRVSHTSPLGRWQSAVISGYTQPVLWRRGAAVTNGSLAR